MRAVPLCVWAAYIVVPVEGWGMFPGRPLGLLATTALAIVGWTAFARRSGLPWSAVAIALSLKVVVGLSVLVPHGFAARYFANANFSGPIELSTEPADDAFSRTDHRLRFGIDDQPDVPLAFFNDQERFNFYRENEPDRNTLPFSVTWQGFWRVTSQLPQTLYVSSPAGAAQIGVGDTFSRRIEPGERWIGAVTFPPGLYRVTIAWSVPQGGARQFGAGRIVNGQERPFDDEVIVRRKAGTTALAADRALRAATRVLDACFIGWLLLQLVSGLSGAYRRLRQSVDPRDALTLIWALGIGDALVAAVPALGRNYALSGGNDWLTYEWHARDIALHGPWMTHGAALGHGSAFFQQAFYPYFLAACHWLFGDGLFGVYFVQRLFVASTIVALWRTTARLFDERTGLAAMVVAIVVVYEKFAPWSAILLSETLFVPLVCLWMYTLVRFAESPTRGRAITAGSVGGLATLTRSSLLLGWAAVIPALAFGLGCRRQRLGRLALLVATMIAITSTATIRNWIVARQFVAIASEGAVVLFVGNSPPPLTIPPSHKAQYERLGVDPMVQAVAEYARQQPRNFARGLWRKAQYTLGWFDAIRPGAGTSVFYIATWMMALAGVALLPWAAPKGSLCIAVIPLLVAASHFAVVVLFQPHVYGERLLMPLYMLLVPYAALPIAALARIAMGFGRERAALACWILLGLAVIARTAGAFAAIDLDVLVIALLAAGLCFAGMPELRPLRVAIYATYAVVLGVWLLRDTTAPRGPTCRAEWLFLAVALFSGALLPPSAAAAPAQASITRRLTTYALSATLTIALLRAIGGGVDPERALLAGRVAAFGLAGAGIYALVWIEGGWPAGPTMWMMAAEGTVVGFFVEILRGTELANAAAPLLLWAALAIGTGPRHSMRGAGASLPP
jgi:hypothetical protein